MINSHQLFIMVYCAINPVLAIIVYSNISKDLLITQRIWIIISSVISTFIIFSCCLYFGKSFLKWMDIPFYVIQLGGGLLILVVGIGHTLITEHMVEMRSFMHRMTMFGQNQVNPPRLNSSMIFDGYKRWVSLGFLPLAVPIMVNPVSILILLFEGLDTNIILQPHITMTILAICIIQGVILFKALWVRHTLGQIGLLVISRISGLCLTIIAFEMLVTGLKSLITIITGIG